jgi:hypothetical protein
MGVGSQKRRQSFVPWRAVAASGRSAVSQTTGRLSIVSQASLRAVVTHSI